MRSWLAIAVGVLLVAALGYLVCRSTTVAPIWDDSVTGVRFRLFEATAFTMGTPRDEALREAQEVLHGVRISHAFYLAETEVTQGQWMQVMGENPSQFQRCGPDCPVERVNWFDVQRFIARLNGYPGRRYRLPTEAEWELACRGHSSLPFGGGRALSSQFANINGHYPYNAPVGPHRRSTTPVRHFPPNWAGLYDMAGNVWEWTADEYCPYAEGPVTDPVGRCESGRRVIRGGSWAFDGGSARCGVRYWHRPQDSGYSLGLRLAHDAL